MTITGSEQSAVTSSAGRFNYTGPVVLPEWVAQESDTLRRRRLLVEWRRGIVEQWVEETGKVGQIPPSLCVAGGTCPVCGAEDVGLNYFVFGSGYEEDLCCHRCWGWSKTPGDPAKKPKGYQGARLVPWKEHHAE